MHCSPRLSGPALDHRGIPSASCPARSRRRTLVPPRRPSSPAMRAAAPARRAIATPASLPNHLRRPDPSRSLRTTLAAECWSALQRPCSPHTPADRSGIAGSPSPPTTDPHYQTARAANPPRAHAHARLPPRVVGRGGAARARASLRPGSLSRPLLPHLARHDARGQSRRVTRDARGTATNFAGTRKTQRMVTRWYFFCCSNGNYEQQKNHHHPDTRTIHDDPSLSGL